MGSLNSINFNNDVQQIIIKYLTNQNVYMLYLSHAMFFHLKQMHRLNLMTFSLAIENKSIEYVKYIEKKKSKKLCVEDYYIDIILTNDLKFITYFINPNNPEHKIIINKTINVNSTTSKCLAEIIYYLHGGKMTRSNPISTLEIYISRLIHYERYDVIDMLEMDGINICEYLNEVIENNVIKLNLHSLKYFHKNDIELSESKCNIEYFCNNLEYTKFAIEYLKLSNHWVRKKIESNLFKISTDVFIWLYKNNYRISCETNNYSYAYINNLMDILDIKYDPLKLTLRMIIFDASHGIFNERHSQIVHTIFPFQENLIITLIFYIIKHKRFDLYHYYTFQTSHNIHDMIKMILATDNLDFIIEYCNSDQPLKKLSQYPYLHNNDNAIKIFYEHSILKPVNIANIILLHKYKLKKLYDCYINNLHNLDIHVDNLSCKKLKYVCKIREIKLLKLISSKSIKYKKIAKYCDLHTLLEIDYFKDYSTSNNSVDHIVHINYALKYGNNQIIDHILNNYSLNKYSIYYAYQNNKNLANRIVEKDSPFSMNNLLFRGKTECSTKFDNYCSWLLTLKITTDQNTLTNIIKTHHIPFLRFYIKNYGHSFTDKDIENIANLNNVEILLYCKEIIPTLEFTESFCLMLLQKNLTNILNFLTKQKLIKFPKDIHEYYL